MDIFFLFVIIFIIAIDQLSKGAAVSYLERRGKDKVRKKFITFTIAKNGGAALGFLQNSRKLLVSLTVVLMATVAYYFFDSLHNDEMFLIKLSLAFILGGGIGNLIDRLRLKYVIDFFSFNFRRSPIFNLADIFIFIGVITLQVIVIFFF